MTKKFIFNGFTLAEVLITLAIIGVVAALTLPSLMQKQAEKATVTRLKKFYSIMDNAVRLTIQQEGEISSWNLTRCIDGTDNPDLDLTETYKSQNTILDKLTKNLKIIYKCHYNEEPCTSNKEYPRYSMDGTLFNTWSPKAILNDGTVIVHFWVAAPNCDLVKGTSKPLQNICGEIGIDINGSKLPNATGKDVFIFYITKFGLYPMGTEEETISPSMNFYDLCNRSKTSRINGYGCSAWVIYNENLDYLHCDDLSWTGKHSCRQK